MKKVAIIVDNIERVFSPNIKGGGSVVAQQLINELRSRNNTEITVFSSPCNHSEIDLPIRIIDYGHGSEEFYCGIQKIIKEENFDDVITLFVSFPFGKYILQSQTFKSRCLNLPLIPRLIKTYLSRKKIKMQEDQFKKYKAKYIAVANCVKEDYIKNLNLNPSDVTVSYPATHAFYDSYPQIRKSEKINFGLVAGSSVNKGGYLFVIALGILNLLRHSFSATIIAPKYNSDPLYKSLVSIFFLKNKIKFLTNKVDMKTFYDSIDCLVLPSLNEAFGLVAIEAMACAKPCLISSTAGVAEIVENESSFIFNRKSFLSYLKSLINICNIYQKDFELYEKYSLNAYELSKKYTWKNFVDGILEQEDYN